MTTEVHIAGLIVYLRPEWLAAVRGVIERFPACEIVSAHPSGKLILVLETGGTQTITETIRRIEGLDGVLNTVMAYHHCEDETELNEELQHEVDPS